MKSIKSLLLLFSAVPFATGFSQTATDLNEGLSVSHGGTTGTLSWFGQEDRAYFILTSFDLISWNYQPVIEVGEHLVVSWGFLPDGSSNKAFFRLRYTDQFMFDAWSEDLDGDSVSNMDELLQNTDPFTAFDGDGNGLMDDWELFYSITSKSNDEEPDTLSNQIESLIGSNPNKDYSATLKLEIYSPN
jgi:hypothetical protein